MSKKLESLLYYVSNEYVAAASSLTLHVNNIEESDKKDIVTNIEIEAIVH